MPEYKIVFVNAEGLEKDPKVVPERDALGHASPVPPGTVGFYYTKDGVRDALTFYINPSFMDIAALRADGNYGPLVAQLEAAGRGLAFFPTVNGIRVDEGIVYDANLHREVYPLD